MCEYVPHRHILFFYAVEYKKVVKLYVFLKTNRYICLAHSINDYRHSLLLNL